MAIRPTLGTLGGPDTNRPIWLAIPIRAIVRVGQPYIHRPVGSTPVRSNSQLTLTAISALTRSRRSGIGTWTSRYLEVSRSWAKDEDLSFVQKRSICLTR